MAGQLDPVPELLSRDDQRQLLRLARLTLDEFVINQHEPSQYKVSSLRLAKRLHGDAGAFVTLHCDAELRGCIGSIFATAPLFRTVIDNTIAAASMDPRFVSIRKDELPTVEIEISVLSPLEQFFKPSEIEVGKHGVYVTLGSFRGLLLPQVATEYGWTAEEFLRHTAEKAGLPASSWQETKLFRFSAQVFSEGRISGNASGEPRP